MTPEENAALIERRLMILELALFGHSGDSWHRTEARDGWLFGHIGSCCFVLDPQTRRPVSRGYHSIIGTDGDFQGCTGTRIERFRVDLIFRNNQGNSQEAS